jgi:hypothetical protein
VIELNCTCNLITQEIGRKSIFTRFFILSTFHDFNSRNDYNTIQSRIHSHCKNYDACIMSETVDFCRIKKYPKFSIHECTYLISPPAISSWENMTLIILEHINRINIFEHSVNVSSGCQLGKRLLLPRVIKQPDFHSNSITL